MYNKYRKQEPQKCVLPFDLIYTTKLGRAYVVLFYLHKMITKVIIKAIAMKVVTINPKDNRYINLIRIVSIIAPPPILQ